MSGARLHTLLPELTTRQPVMVVGAAVIDVIADAYALPWRGCDIVITAGVWRWLSRMANALLCHSAVWKISGIASGWRD